MENRGIKAAALAAARDGNFENFLAASEPGGIERMEAAGQRKLIAHADRLPVDGTIEDRHNRGNNRAAWESVGFVFGDKIPHENNRFVFVACTFPKGWSLKPTSHSMWSDVIDDKGRRRAMVFFKAAFYDYKSHTFGLECRYRSTTVYDNDPNSDRRRIAVIDTTLPEPGIVELVKEFTTSDDYFANSLQFEDRASKRLLELFPDAKNPMAYWD